jgi:hypothetical protein
MGYCLKNCSEKTSEEELQKNTQMKCRTIYLFFALLLYTSLTAQTTPPGKSGKYDVVVSFGSMCCGTASDDFLKDFIKNCYAKNRDTIRGWVLNGCGREGEYKILFSLTALEKSKKTRFIDRLAILIDEQNKKNKAVNASSGSVSMKTDLPLADFDYCRGDLKLWN